MLIQKIFCGNQCQIISRLIIVGYSPFKNASPFFGLVNFPFWKVLAEKAVLDYLFRQVVFDVQKRTWKLTHGFSNQAQKFQQCVVFAANRLPVGCIAVTGINNSVDSQTIPKTANALFEQFRVFTWQS